MALKVNGLRQSLRGLFAVGGRGSAVRKEGRLFFAFLDMLTNHGAV